MRGRLLEFVGMMIGLAARRSTKRRDAFSFGTMEWQRRWRRRRRRRCRWRRRRRRQAPSTSSSSSSSVTRAGESVSRWKFFVRLLSLKKTNCWLQVHFFIETFRCACLLKLSDALFIETFRCTIPRASWGSDFQNKLRQNCDSLPNHLLQNKTTEYFWSIKLCAAKLTVFTFHYYYIHYTKTHIYKTAVEGCWFTFWLSRK